MLGKCHAKPDRVHGVIKCDICKLEWEMGDLTAKCPRAEDKSMEGRKDDEGKVRMELIPPELMIAVGDILTFGAKKYSLEYQFDITSLSEKLVGTCSCGHITHRQNATQIASMLLKDFALAVTKRSTQKQNEQNATRSGYLTYADFVEAAMTGNLKIKTQNTQNDKEKTPFNGLSLTKTEKGVLIENISHRAELKKDEPNLTESEHFLHMGSQSEMKLKSFLGRITNAQSADVSQSDFLTSTTITELERFADLFATDATRELAYSEILSKVLSEHSDTCKVHRLKLTPKHNGILCFETGDRNWEHGMKWSRVYGALLRHLTAWWGGEDKDPETGRSHLWHVACCVTFLLTYEMRGAGEDDRWKG
jgi:hypothetical protein